MALGKTGDGAAWLVPEKSALIVAAIALVTTIATSLLGRGWFKLVPILIGIAVGYAAAFVLDLTGVSAAIQAGFEPGSLKNWTGPQLVSFKAVSEAPWFAVPNFVLPEWKWEAVLFIVPVAIAPAIEHFGDVLAISGITGKNYVDDPGIKNTMLGDGLATSLASFLGGPPNTTYSEVSGAVALTKVFNPGIMTWAAITAIVLAFVGKLGALLQTIPVPVMGGIMILLFGAIMVVGMNTLVRAGDDLMEPRNLALVAIIVIFGVGGMSLPLGSEARLGGIGLAGITGVVLNLILPRSK